MHSMHASFLLFHSSFSSSFSHRPSTLTAGLALLYVRPRRFILALAHLNRAARHSPSQPPTRHRLHLLRAQLFIPLPGPACSRPAHSTLILLRHAPLLKMPPVGITGPAKPDEPQPIVWSSIHSDPSAEVVLVSREGVHFRVHLWYLKKHSQLIADMVESATGSLADTPINVPGTERAVDRYITAVLSASAAGYLDLDSYEAAVARFMQSDWIIKAIKDKARSFLKIAPWATFLFACGLDDLALAQEAVKASALEEDRTKRTTNLKRICTSTKTKVCDPPAWMTELQWMAHKHLEADVDVPKTPPVEPGVTVLGRRTRDQRDQPSPSPSPSPERPRKRSRSV